MVNFLPELSDLLAAGVAAVTSMAMSGMGSPQNSAMEQLGSQIVGKVGAGYFNITDAVQSPTLGITEHDAFVGASRAGYSLSQKRSNQRVLMEGLKGVLCSVAGKQLAQNLQGTTPTV